MPIIPWATRVLINDFSQRFTNSGLCVYLRLKNTVDDTLPYTRLGWNITGSGSNPGGYTDVLITPPPDVTPINSRNTGIPAGRLQFGPHRFIISHTFVLAQMAIYSYTDPYQVWRNSQVMGFYYDGRLYAIESILDLADGGALVRWDITASAHELPAAPLNT